MEIAKAYLYLTNALANIYGTSEAESITSILFEDAFGVTNSQKMGVLTHIQGNMFLEYAERLLRKEPIQYVLGQADFFGMKLEVSPDVLIPRQETEELVAWVLKSNTTTTKKRIIDIGAGSGCIALALKKNLPKTEVWAIDISKKALQIAEQNAQIEHLDIFFKRLDIFDTKGWAPFPVFDIIVSNPPYIPAKEKSLMPAWVLEHEPHIALFSKDDPLLFYKAIADFALKKGRKNVQLFLELNEYHAPKVQRMLIKKGFSEVAVQHDLNGKQRMLRALL